MEVAVVKLMAMMLNVGLEPGVVKLKMEIPLTAASFHSLELMRALAKNHDSNLRRLEI